MGEDHPDRAVQEYPLSLIAKELEVNSIAESEQLDHGVAVMSEKKGEEKKSRGIFSFAVSIFSGGKKKRRYHVCRRNVFVDGGMSDKS